MNIAAGARASATLLHTLHLYGAAGLTALGWAVCRLLDWPAAPWLPLWFCAALLIYNADRLHPDPADRLNLPQRAAASHRWRRLSRAVCAGAALYLIAAPLLQRDWLTLGLVLGGTFISLQYSIPLLGFRWKDVPLLKTLFAPSIITAALLGLPLLHRGLATDRTTFLLTALHTGSFLLFNMILCDLRDLPGDRASGVRSLPVLLGEKRTRHLLIALLIVIALLALAALRHSPPHHTRAWLALSIATPLYLAALLLATRQPRPERFHEWWVEGMLFLPAAVLTALPA